MNIGIAESAESGLSWQEITKRMCRIAHWQLRSNECVVFDMVSGCRHINYRESSRIPSVSVGPLTPCLWYHEPLMSNGGLVVTELHWNSEPSHYSSNYHSLYPKLPIR